MYRMHVTYRKNLISMKCPKYNIFVITFNEWNRPLLRSYFFNSVHKSINLFNQPQSNYEMDTIISFLCNSHMQIHDTI